MSVNLNPQSPARAGAGNTARDTRRAAPANLKSEFAPPPERAHVNFIPSAESLATLIESAVAALRKGVYWDRGTLLNLVV